MKHSNYQADVFIVYTEEFESQAYLLQKELLRYTSIAVSTLPDKATLDSNIVYNVIKT